jgi:hypothetical protein
MTKFKNFLVFLFILLACESMASGEGAEEDRPVSGAAVRRGRPPIIFIMQQDPPTVDIFNIEEVETVARTLGKMGAIEFALSGIGCRQLLANLATVKHEHCTLVMENSRGKLIAKRHPRIGLVPTEPAGYWITDYLSTFNYPGQSLYVQAQARRVISRGKAVYMETLLFQLARLAPKTKAELKREFDAFAPEASAWLKICRREVTENPLDELMEHARFMAHQVFWQLNKLKKQLMTSPDTWTAENFALYEPFSRIILPEMKEVMRVMLLRNVENTVELWSLFLMNFSHRTPGEISPSERIRELVSKSPMFDESGDLKEEMFFKSAGGKSDDVAGLYECALSWAGLIFKQDDETADPSKKIFTQDPALNKRILRHLVSFGGLATEVEGVRIGRTTYDESGGWNLEGMTVPVRPEKVRLQPTHRAFIPRNKGLVDIFDLMGTMRVDTLRTRDSLLSLARLYDQYRDSPDALQGLVRSAVEVADKARGEEDKTMADMERRRKRIEDIGAAIAEIEKQIEEQDRVEAEEERKRLEMAAAAAKAEEAEAARQRREQAEKERQERAEARRIELMRERAEQMRLREEEEKKLAEIAAINARIHAEKKRAKAARREAAAAERATAATGGASYAEGGGSGGRGATGEEVDEEVRRLARDAMPTVRRAVSAQTAELIRHVSAGDASDVQLISLFSDLGYVVKEVDDGYKVKFNGKGRNYMMKTFHRDHGGDRRDPSKYRAARELLEAGGYL